MTDDVNENVSKAQIIYQLSKSIASSKFEILFPIDFIGLYLAVSADGFNLYLVDETGSTLRLFTAENDE